MRVLLPWYPYVKTMPARQLVLHFQRVHVHIRVGQVLRRAIDLHRGPDGQVIRSQHVLRANQRRDGVPVDGIVAGAQHDQAANEGIAGAAAAESEVGLVGGSGARVQQQGLRNAVVGDAEAAAQHDLVVVARGRPGKAQARRKIVAVWLVILRHRLHAGVQQSGVVVRAREQVGHSVLQVRQRAVELVAQAEIHRQVGLHLPVVLQERSVIVSAEVGVAGGDLPGGGIGGYALKQRR